MKGYHVLNLESNLVVETCDVTFDEASPARPEFSGTPQVSETLFLEEDNEDGVGQNPIPRAPVAEPATTSLPMEDGPVPSTSSTTSVMEFSRQMS